MKTDLSANLGVSAIAWEPEHDNVVADLLVREGLSNIDIAPTKYAQWEDESLLRKMTEVKTFWADKGISIRGFQSLMFGLPDLNVLEPENRILVQNHFEIVFQAAQVSGARKLIFGSPKNRFRGHLSFESALEKAERIFGKLAQMASDHGVQLLLEPNPIQYGCDFINTTDEAAQLTKAIGSDGFKVNFDLGTCLYGNESVIETFENYKAEIGYVHLSTAELKPLAESPNPKITQFLDEVESAVGVSIEQRVNTDDVIGSIMSSLEWLR